MKNLNIFNIFLLEYYILSKAPVYRQPATHSSIYCFWLCFYFVESLGSSLGIPKVAYKHFFSSKKIHISISEQVWYLLELNQFLRVLYKIFHTFYSDSTLKYSLFLRRHKSNLTCILHFSKPFKKLFLNESSLNILSQNFQNQY